MKLLNQSILFISVSILAIIGLWGILFYFNMNNEIKESVDEGLDNYRRQIVYQAHQDTVLLKRVDFNEGFYAIHEITRDQAEKITDRYSDTTIFIPKGADNIDLHPYRMLTTAFKDDGRYYQLRVINSMVEKDDLISQTFRNIIGLYFILIISIIIINNLILRRVWKPFYSLLRQLKSFNIGSNASIPKIETSTTEFQDLQEAIKTLLSHARSAYQQQKEFIGNAAHELQTPLSIALNRLELLLEKQDLTPIHAEDIAETMKLIERMTRLNKSLLLLTKIENFQFNQKQKISFNALTHAIIHEVEEGAAFKSINITLEEQEKLMADMDPSLAEILIANLIRNAIFHSPNDGLVDITLTKQLFTIRNQGIKPLDDRFIFNRFHKLSSKPDRTGLGLSIVKAICKLYGFHISYHFADNQHTFTINFSKL